MDCSGYRRVGCIHSFRKPFVSFKDAAVWIVKSSFVQGQIKFFSCCVDKWIVFSTGPCDEQYRCSIGDYVLARMPVDGSRTEVVADTVAREPSFAPDGKKLVYWKVIDGQNTAREFTWTFNVF